MCEYESLYFSDTSYVLRCKKCGDYQVAFLNTLLMLTAEDFGILCKVVELKCFEDDSNFGMQSKCIIIPTPSYGQCILLTRWEASCFNNILQEADNEAKAQSLLQLFY